MEFWIQASQPRASGEYEENDETIGEAVETVFPLWTESAFIVWKGVYVPLSYKYDLSAMLPDILTMLERLLTSHSGEMSVYWPSNTFAATWRLEWRDRRLALRAKWDQVVGGTNDLLTGKGQVCADKQQFAVEWRQPLAIILDALVGAGYGGERIPDISRLAETTDMLSRLSRSGHLYTHG